MSTWEKKMGQRGGNFLLQRTTGSWSPDQKAWQPRPESLAAPTVVIAQPAQAGSLDLFAGYWVAPAASPSSGQSTSCRPGALTQAWGERTPTGFRAA